MSCSFAFLHPFQFYNNPVVFHLIKSDYELSLTQKGDIFIGWCVFMAAVSIFKVSLHNLWVEIFLKSLLL